MTNAEKYLKEGVSVEELIFDIINFEKCWNRKDFDKEVKRMKKFFFTSLTPTLTEDERVILRNIKNFTTIIRNIEGNIQVENEDGSFACLCAFNHLFQFIKERRRI